MSAYVPLAPRDLPPSTKKVHDLLQFIARSTTSSSPEDTLQIMSPQTLSLLNGLTISNRNLAAHLSAILTFYKTDPPPTTPKVYFRLARPPHTPPLTPPSPDLLPLLPPNLPSLPPNTPLPNLPPTHPYHAVYTQHSHLLVLNTLLTTLYTHLFELTSSSTTPAKPTLTLGHLHSNGTTVPLLTIPLTVTLDATGALLVSPEHHTKIAANIPIITPLTTPENVARVTALLRTVLPGDVRLGDVNSYKGLLKRVAVLTAPTAIFSARPSPTGISVTPTFAVTVGTPSSSIYSRDATQFSANLTETATTPSPTTLPLAVYNLTDGPSRNFAPSKGTIVDSIKAVFKASPPPTNQQYFPLPVSPAQASLHATFLPDTPCYVIEGPPGTGKTHTIANVLAERLGRGERVLVTR